MRSLAVAIGVWILSANVCLAGAKDYFTEFSKDFGPTPRGPILTHYFQIENTSKETITLGTARVSCGCVSASILKNQLSPGETTVVATYMDTRRIPQANVIKAVLVYVPFLSPTQEEVTLKVQSIARDDLVFSPETLNLGDVKQGKEATAKAKITLFNFEKWDISEANSKGKYISVTTKLVNRQNSEVTYEVTAKLDPKCPVGNWVSEVYLKTNAPGLDRIRIPVSVNVTPAISVNPGAIKIGEVKVGSTNEMKIILQSNRNFQVKEIKELNGLLTAKSDSSEARSTHTITIKVAPTTVGAVNQQLEVTTNHEDMPKLLIDVTGKIIK